MVDDRLVTNVRDEISLTRAAISVEEGRVFIRLSKIGDRVCPTTQEVTAAPNTDQAASSTLSCTLSKKT